MRSLNYDWTVQNRQLAVGNNQLFYGLYSICVIICEQTHNDTNMQHWPNAKDSLYEMLLYSKKINTTLKVPKNSCKFVWIYQNDKCFGFYLGFVDDMFGCQHFTPNEVKFLLLKLTASTLKNILHQFVNMPFIGKHSTVHIIQCNIPPEQNVFHLPKVFFQCADDTVIIQHHVCDGEADCPDGSGEYNCTWLCDFQRGAHNCFSDCIKPSCTYHQLYYQCQSGGCIPASKVCNSINDCNDSSDESLYSQYLNIRIMSDNNTLFRCQSGQKVNFGYCKSTNFGGYKIWRFSK